MASIGADSSLAMAELEKVQTPRKSHHQDISPSSIVTLPGQITESSGNKAEKEAGGPPNNDGPTTSSVESSDVEDEEETPDGGAKAWLMILGAWCCSFCSYGWLNSKLSCVVSSFPVLHFCPIPRNLTGAECGSRPIHPAICNPTTCR